MNKPCTTLAAVGIRPSLPIVLVTLALCLSAHSAEAPVRTELMLELLFDGNLADTSLSNRACTSQGTVMFVDGRQGKCMSFDGRSWIDTGLLQKELGDMFTVECWVNPGMRAVN